MPLPPFKQVPFTAPGSPYSQGTSSVYQSRSRSAVDLRHSDNDSTSTLQRGYVAIENSRNSDTPRASEFTSRRSPSPSHRFSALSINDSINSQDFRMSTLSTLTISQYQSCHPYFWFSDGSIVLSVQTMLFKVHRSTLATHSEMFADMFNVGHQGLEGQSEDEDEWFDGCRVVKLFDDSSEDWVDLLSAIYKPNHFDDVPARQFQIRHSPSNPDASQPYNAIPSSEKPFNLSVALDFTTGILRLSHKYLIPHLRARCLSLLAPFFPTTFEDFAISMPLLNPQFLSTPPSPLKKRDRDSGPLMTRTSTLLRAVNLFHAVDVPQFLPYAYYCLSKLSSKRILHTRELDPAEPPRAELSWREKAMIIHGKEQLRLAATKDTMACLGGFRRAVGCDSEYEDDGCIRSPMYSHHVALKECDYAARAAWDNLLRGNSSMDNTSGTVRGGATAAANAAWASTASLLTLNVNATSHASAYAPPIASTSSSGSTGSSSTSGALHSLNFPSSAPESINLIDPFAPFLGWDTIGPSIPRYSSPYSSYATPHRSYTSLAQATPYTSTLYVHQQPDYKISGEPVMCRACLNECQIQHYDARRRVWEALPEIFGLGTWDELKRRTAS
ncbi:hypothetical protein BJ165DRAFT_1398399 [Panaeolus papilionaceus]|nr:hypothetical protein BJ165DRAFT_1398399 [Panaeolus papilionaceus]